MMKIAGALGLTFLLAASLPAAATPVTFDENGLATGAGAVIGNYYAGGAGPNLGVDFSATVSPPAYPALAFIFATGNSDHTGSGGVMLLACDPPSNCSSGQSIETIIGVGAGFTSLTFDWWVTGEFSIDLYDASGANVKSSTFNAGSGMDNQWESSTIDNFGTSAAVKAVIAGGHNDVFLDNLIFVPPSTGGGAPEPGSFALVGLALAAAWGARRRSNA
jgi:PEP-CTERM motif